QRLAVSDPPSKRNGASTRPRGWRRRRWFGPFIPDQLGMSPFRSRYAGAQGAAPGITQPIFPSRTAISRANCWTRPKLWGTDQALSAWCPGKMHRTSQRINLYRPQGVREDDRDEAAPISLAEPG